MDKKEQKEEKLETRQKEGLNVLTGPLIKSVCTRPLPHGRLCVLHV